MSESISQGIPSLKLFSDISLLKLNDITYSSLKKDGFSCISSQRKPDQLVVKGKKIIIAIEDKLSSADIDQATNDLEKKYLEALPETNYFIARAGDRTKVFFKISKNKIVEIGTTLKGKEVLCFGPKMITGENKEILNNLKFFAKEASLDKSPNNGSLEIKPPENYYNPLIVKENTIYNLWQKIFVSTGEDAHKCLETFVELLLYKGLSDADVLPSDFKLKNLLNMIRGNSLRNYKNNIRKYIKEDLFPTLPDQPGVINGFAFNQEESAFKNVLTELDNLGNLAQKQIDPDFKRRIIEAFLGSANKEGTIKNGKHLTPRTIIQMIWEISEVKESKTVMDPACGVGGFILEGLNYPYEFNPLKLKSIGIDRAEEMVIVAKANMILHLLDKFSDTNISNEDLAKKINQTFIHSINNGTGTLGELDKEASGNNEFTTKHVADYVFANVPFYVNGVSQIDESLDDLGLKNYYQNCGIGIESRFLKYIIGVIERGDPGIAFVIVTDGILYRHLDKARSMLNYYTDITGIISLPKGVFQNNNWKTSILIFKKKKRNINETSPVFIYNIENIGISLDSYRAPIKENDIPNLKKAWQKKESGNINDPKAKLISRKDFLDTKRWNDLFAEWRVEDKSKNITFGEFIEESTEISKEISDLIKNSNKKIENIFSLESFLEVELGDENYFNTGQASPYVTITRAKRNSGDYPLFSSKIDGPAEHMEDKEIPPINCSKNKKIISWNIKGEPAKDIRVHDEEFYCTENRGLIVIKHSKIDFNYVLYYLREHLIELGKFSREDEAHAGKVKSIKINIPTDKKGEFDLLKQKEIIKNYEIVSNIRKELKDKINQLNNSISNIDIFK